VYWYIDVCVSISCIVIVGYSLGGSLMYWHVWFSVAWYVFGLVYVYVDVCICISLYICVMMYDVVDW